MFIFIAPDAQEFRVEVPQQAHTHHTGSDGDYHEFDWRGARVRIGSNDVQEIVHQQFPTNEFRIVLRRTLTTQELTAFDLMKAV